jgi:hypothetical protein
MTDETTNQHHTDVTPATLREALLTFVDQWTRAGCECCSPTVLDEAFDGLVYADHADDFRRVGIALAMAGQCMVEQVAEDFAELERSS